METNNILMAEFLGWKLDDKSRYVTPFGEMDESGYFRFDCEKRNLQFEIDWNWLMMVVEKIESLGSTVVFEQDNLVIITTMTSPSPYKVKQQSVTKESKIEAAYIACIEFIKWYNSNNNEHN